MRFPSKPSSDLLGNTDTDEWVSGTALIPFSARPCPLLLFIHGGTSFTAGSKGPQAEGPDSAHSCGIRLCPADQ